MSRNDLVDHSAAWYVPQNTVLSVAGNTTHKAVVEEAQKLFGEQTGGEPPPIEPAKEGRPERHIIVEARDITPSNLRMSVRAVSRTDPDRYPVTIMTAVLGQGTSPGLVKPLRERAGRGSPSGSASSRGQTLTRG